MIKIWKILKRIFCRHRFYYADEDWFINERIFPWQKRTCRKCGVKIILNIYERSRYDDVTDFSIR